MDGRAEAMSVNPVKMATMGDHSGGLTHCHSWSCFGRDPLGGRSLARRVGLISEYIGPQQLKELAACTRDSLVAPLADRGRPDFAKARYFGGSTKGVNDLRIVHTIGMLGAPKAECNRQTYRLDN